MRWLTHIFIFMLFGIVLGQKSFASNPCSKFLSSPHTQDQIKIRENEIHALIDQYAQKLGVYQDPFALVFSAEQGEKIFQKLLVRTENGRVRKSPLAIINHALMKERSRTRKYNEKLVQWIVNDARQQVSRADHRARADLQSDLLALKYTLEYLRRYQKPDVIVDRDGISKEQSQKSKQNSKENNEKQDRPPEYPELPDQYKPFTKDTQNQGSGSQKQYRVAEVNFKTPFFVQKHFPVIVRGADHPFQQAMLPITPPALSKFQSTAKQLIVRTFGKKKVALFIPPLFKPLQPTDPRAVISRSETGEYILELNGDLSNSLANSLAEVHIPLTEDANITMMPPVREIYLRPVGFTPQEWPDQIQAAILRRFSAEDAKLNPLQVAQAIANHIATQYLYSIDARPETDPIDTLKAGAFQCDMAAYAMVGLLRDVYQIPSEAIGGFRAKKYQDGADEKSYLVMPSEAHTLVAVFHDGKWHFFDPTPIKKDKKTDDQNGKNEYADNTLENTPKSEYPEHNKDQTSEQVKDHKQRVDEDTQKRINGLEENKSKDPKNDEPKNNDQENDLTKEDLANQLELGSLELEPTLDRNALFERAMRVLLQIAVEPTQSGLDVQNRLNQLSSLMRRFHSVELKKLYQDALSAHAADHPGLKNWIDELTRLMPGQDVNKTYQALYKIRLALQVYSKVLDRTGKIQVPEKLMETLDEVQRKIDELAHPDSQDIALVQDLVKNLPSVARLLLKSQFDLTAVGPNAPTREVASRLKSGSLNDLRLLSILSPLSDFILNSTPRPETIEIRTWTRDSARPIGRDLLPLQRFSDLPRAVLGQPGKSVEENLRDGTVYVPTRRQRIQIPAGYGKEEAERITIVLYDTSGSMNGDPGRFQAGLIGAFTAKALSDVSPSGRHRHRVVLVPFDDKVGKPFPVTNTQEALDVIRNYQKELKNTNGGTDIQKALLQAMSLIADAERRSGEPLAAANIILMSDGQAQVDTAELLRARQAIDRQTPLQNMFIAINQTNEELMRFSMDSQAMGAERGFYREFTTEHIKDILHEADHLDITKASQGFYSEKTARDIPSEVYELMNQAPRLAAEFSDQIFYGNQYLPAAEHLKELEKLKWRDISHVDRPLETWLIKVRGMVIRPIFKDRRVLERVVDDLVNNLERLTGVKSDALSSHEQEQLKHLVGYAAGLEGPNGQAFVR